MGFNDFILRYGTLLIGFLLLLAVIFALAPQRTDNIIPTAPNVDLNRYTGTWYSTHEIPSMWTDECSCTQAEYILQSDGVMRVKNACVKDGVLTVVEGTAKQKNAGDPTRLDLRLDGTPTQFFPADYLILDAASDYRFAVVSNNDASALWILSRERTISHEDYVGIIQYLATLDIDITKIKPVQQTNCSEVVIA